jgi:predicted phage tail protein
MKKTIILHGYLKELHDQPIEVEAETVAEALRLLNTIEAFKRADPFPVTVDGVETDIALFSVTSLEEIHVRPQLEGGGGRGFMQVMLGAVLVAVGFAAGPAGILGISQSTLYLSGALMITGGLLQMLYKAPNPEDQKSSRYIGSTVNSVQIGTRIPILYGVRKIGGHFMSFDVDAKDYSGDAGDTSVEDSFIDGGGTLLVYDRPVFPDGIAPVNPVYLSPTRSPSNTPISSWSG